MNHAVTLNAIACFVLVAGGIVFCIFSRKRNRGHRRFVYRATVIWTFGLFAWLILWVLYESGVFKWGDEGSWQSNTAMLLSDVNTAAGFLFYVIITRGQRNRIWDHIRDALPLLTLPAVATLSILAYDWKTQANVHTGLSLAYSMITPVLVGWAIRLRFMVVLPLALSCLYAILQPPAYGALFGKPADIDQSVALIGLAIAKVIWGSVVFYALARKVTNSDSLVTSVAVSRRIRRPQAILFYIQLSLGIVILLAYLITLREQGRYVLTATAQLVGIAAAIVAVVLGILTYHKKTDQSVYRLSKDALRARNGSGRSRV
jgi:hypothetical protein